MEKTSPENPRPQDGGSPSPPPPPAAKSDGATHNRTDSDDDEGCVKSLFRSYMFVASYLLLGHVWRNIILSFDLDYVSLSTHNNNNDPRANVTAVWDIGFSTHPFVDDLNVSLRFMSRDFKFENVVHGDDRARNATVTALLPRDFVFPESGGLMLEEVMIEGNLYPRYGVKAACKNVTLGLSPEGIIMEGGPRSCPIVHYGHIF